ncbi:MAG: hypothetical protein ACPHSD_13215 [Candidatus Latescibacterota bacterium]
MTEENGDTIDWQTILPSKLRLALWKHIDQRLHRGDILITDDHFLEVMQEEFSRLVGVAPSAKIREAMRAMIHLVNQEHPNKYLIFGIRNMMTSYTRSLLDRLGDDSEQALKEGTERIKNMVREGRTVLFLESIGIELGEQGLPHSIELAIERVVNSKHLDMPLEQFIEKPEQQSIKRPRVVEETSEEAVEESDEVLLSDIGEKDLEQSQYELEAIEHEQELIEEELEGAHRHLESYHQQGLIDYADVTSLRALKEIDQAVVEGKLTPEEAERRRDNVENRAVVCEKLEDAVLFGVHHIHIAEGLCRIPTELDELRRLLIRNKASTMTQNGDSEDLKTMLKELERNETLLEHAVRIIERKDHEIRIIAANLPPYRYANDPGKVSNWRVRESFIDELRSLERDELSHQLNSSNEAERTRLATDLSCLIFLIRQLTSNTPLYVGVLSLHICKTVERLYASAPQANSGRQKVHSFLKQRVPRLYPDLTPSDLARIGKDSEQVMFSASAGQDDNTDTDNSMRVFRA